MLTKMYLWIYWEYTGLIQISRDCKKKLSGFLKITNFSRKHGKKKEHIRQMQVKALTYLTVIAYLPMRSVNKFCFDCGMHISASTRRTAVAGPHGLRLMSVKQNIKKFFSVQISSALAGEHAVIEDHEITANCWVPVQTLQHTC